MSRESKFPRDVRRLALLPAIALSFGGMAACEGLLDVDLPGQMTEAAVLQPEMAEIMVLSAIGDFECAYSMFTVLTASMEDTWWRTTGYWGGWAEYRTERPNAGACATGDTNASWYQAFQTSRFQSEQAYEYISGWTDEEVANRERLLAQAATYAGLAYTVFGETYCELAVDVGPLMTNTQVLEEADGWFTLALGHLANTGDFSIVTTESLEQLALLGRARARFALGDHAGAAADAERIEQDFIAYITRDASVRPRWNHIYRQLAVSLYASIAGPVEWEGQTIPFTGYRHLTISPDGTQSRADTINGVLDPRVPVVYSGQFGQDGVTDDYQQLKYTSLDAPIPLARWAEAQLILAEIEGGQSAVDRINALRDVHGLPHYSGPTDPATLRNVIIEERRREFFFEGRFLADKLRYDLWFPRGVGTNHKNVTYGNATCFLMPESEYENNPNLPNP